MIQVSRTLIAGNDVHYKKRNPWSGLVCDTIQTVILLPPQKGATVERKNWPFWITGAVWALVLVALAINGYLRLPGKPAIDFWGWDSAPYMISLLGPVLSITKTKYGLVAMGVFLIAFGIFGTLAAFATASEMSYLIVFVKVSVCAILMGAVNLIAKKA